MAQTNPQDHGTEDESIVVVHVDDDRQLGELVAAYLEKLDDRISVHTESDPRAALDTLASNAVDCVVSDYQMPGMDGIELLRAVREDFPNLPFVLFTGKGSEAVASDAVNADVSAYVQKDGTETYQLLANQIQNAVGRQRSERRARVAQERLLELYEQTDGFFIIDGEWTVTYWSAQMAHRTGRTAEEIIGRTFWEAFPEATDSDLGDRYREAMDTREPAVFETYYEPHGYWVEVRAYPVEEGLFVHSRVITDEKEREREIERRNQILVSFANTVSHDLRNPLSIAEGRLELAQETGDFEHLEAVAKAHNRMRNLIDELLRIARGKELALSDVSLREVSEQAWETVSSGSAELVVEDDVSFRAHDSQLRRLLENCFWNALSHGDATTIRVGTIEAGFYVEDDGTGIPSTDREKVFESGFSTGEESPGYGLSIVNGIVATHEWEIEIGESAEGGARFEIRGVEFVDQ